MDSASNSSLPAVLDPVAAAIIAQLQQKVAAQAQVISEKDARLATYEMHVQKLEEELRMERIRKYGKQSEKLSDLQLELLDGEPAVSSEEIETEAASDPLPKPEKAGEETAQHKNKQHTNWTENSMRPVAIGRRNWLHLGSKEAGPKIAAIFSVVESCRKLNVPIRQYLADILPGLANCSIQKLPALTPTAYAAANAK